MNTLETQVHYRIEQLRAKFYERDRAMERMQTVRDGNLHYLMPDVFSEEFPRSMVANDIDIVARDMAEVMAGLPTLDCASGNGITAADKKRAEKKNKIGAHYWDKSRLRTEMFMFADYFNTFGLAIFAVEPDMSCETPVIRVEDPRGFYYRMDRWGRLAEVVKVFRKSIGDLVAMFPEYEQWIAYSDGKRLDDNHEVELIKHVDCARAVIYIPESRNLIVASTPHVTKRMPYVVVEMPGVSGFARGKFDDALWVQIARAVMAQYTLQAADLSINSPLVIPKDVTQLAFGAGAVIPTDNPNGVSRVQLNVPREVLAYNENLDREVIKAARYPEARRGGTNANIITGRGVEALAGTFDTQLKTFQDLVKEALQDATALCFEIDCAMWPRKRRTITGVQTGRPFSVEYIPARDIGDSYSCGVTYGFAAGMSPAQSLVALLQLRGDNLIGRTTARAQLPFDIDPEMEQRDVDMQSLNDALMQGLMASSQALPALVAQGQDPTAIIVAMSSVIKAREGGKPLHEAVENAFKKPEPEPAAAGMEGLVPEGGPDGPAGAPPGPMGEVAGGPPAGEEGELPPGMNPTGRMLGVAPGQQGMAPGGLGAIQGMIAQLRNGTPTMEASVSRKRGIGMG